MPIPRYIGGCLKEILTPQGTAYPEAFPTKVIDSLPLNQNLNFLNIGELSRGVNNLLNLEAVTFDSQGVKSKRLVKVKVRDASFDASAYYFRTFRN